MFTSTKENTGYEYYVVGRCSRCGRAHVMPLWTGRRKDGTRVDPPVYATCRCGK